MEDRHAELPGVISQDEHDGFTLIELLVVVVIIAVLAMIAIPQFTATREEAYRATLVESLEQLKSAQDSFYGENGRYAALPDTGRLLWSPSTSIRLDTLVSEEEGWWGVATHAKASLKCGYAYGTSTESPSFLDSEGGVACQPLGE